MTGDYDNDGDMDLAIASTAGNKLVILLNGGAGVFYPPTEITHGGPFTLICHDLNLDGALDLICADVLSGSISTFLGNGIGEFGPANTTPVGTSPYSIVAADFDEDGWPDLAVANHQSDNVSLLKGLGNGNFDTGWGSFSYLRPTDLAVSDFDNDGHLDLVATTSEDSNFSVRYGNGTGAFPIANDYMMGIDDALWSTAAADVTGDGLIDLVFPCPAFDQVVVYCALPTGGFFPLPPILTEDEPRETMIRDFDLDGFDDVGVLNLGSASLSLSLSDGSGNFSNAQSFSSGPEPVSMQGVDLDGDGQEDLVVANKTSGTVSVLLNRTLPGGEFRRGDVDVDGMLTIADPVRLLDIFFVGNTTQFHCADAGDVDDDGLLSIGDPLLLLAYLFASGPPPAEPFECGIDPTNTDSLTPCPVGMCQ